MDVYVCLMLLCGVSSFQLKEQPLKLPQRLKREAVGSLDIITNNADPIHADVKSDNARVYEDKVVNLVDNYIKPCPKAVLPSMIEPGVGFKVTPPPASVSSPLIELPQSRRKLHPFNNTLEIIRTISRLILLLVLLASAFIEFYPIILNMFQVIYNLIYL